MTTDDVMRNRASILEAGLSVEGCEVVGEIQECSFCKQGYEPDLGRHMIGNEEGAGFSFTSYPCPTVTVEDQLEAKDVEIEELTKNAE